MTLHVLRRYWAIHRNPELIFPQKLFKAIVASCQIHKRVTIHSLRHCYCTHLLEAGLNLRAIQKAMGHSRPKTTALYTQLTEPMQQNTLEIINNMVDRLTIRLEA
jgi:site-specific recombinase XerD